MKYLLKNKKNHNYNIDEFRLLDCPATLLNHFEQGKNSLNIYSIDLLYYDEMDIFIIKCIIKEIYNINPDWIIYVMGGELTPLAGANSDFTFPNVCHVQSIVDIPS